MEKLLLTPRLADIMQKNLITHEEYTLSNADTLAHVQGNNKENGYTNEWSTFLQASGAGFKVKKGEKAVRLVRVIETKDKKGNTEKHVRKFCVFNSAQLERVEALSLS